MGTQTVEITNKLSKRVIALKKDFPSARVVFDNDKCTIFVDGSEYSTDIPIIKTLRYTPETSKVLGYLYSFDICIAMAGLSFVPVRQAAYHTNRFLHKKKWGK